MEKARPSYRVNQGLDKKSGEAWTGISLRGKNGRLSDLMKANVGGGRGFARLESRGDVEGKGVVEGRRGRKNVNIEQKPDRRRESEGPLPVGQGRGGNLSNEGDIPREAWLLARTGKNDPRQAGFGRRRLGRGERTAKTVQGTGLSGS